MITGWRVDSAGVESNKEREAKSKAEGSEMSDAADITIQQISDNPIRCLTAYTKLILESTAAAELDPHIDRIKALAGQHMEDVPELDWIIRLLAAGKAAVHIKSVSTGDTSDDWRENTLSGPLKDAISTARRWVHGYGTPKPPQFREPIVIVAGGTAPSVEAEIQRYWPLIERTFAEFTGTIISGGTTAGVCGLVGDVESSAMPQPRKLAYLRERLPESARIHPSYQIIRIPGEGFTPLEPIQAWIDILSSGIDPIRVKLLGIDGGDISAFEYRFALAVGASASIVQDSGRAASEIAADEYWGQLLESRGLSYWTA